MLLGYATDELLAPLVGRESHPNVERINSIIRYLIKVPIDADEDLYLSQYVNASLVVQTFLDGLRLCRPKDDVGILALEAIPCSILTPQIRKTGANQFQVELARLEPKRFDFSLPSPQPLTEEEIERIRDIILTMIPLAELEWNLKYAIRRFRYSVEKYSAGDPERLIEYAIALESLYLNDNSNNRGELTYRLSLRVARFLVPGLEKRKDTFSIVNKLYSFRSRIAHGEDISRIKKTKDQDSLNRVLEYIPVIVADSIIKLMKVWKKQKKSNASDFWKDFWKEIELGND